MLGKGPSESPANYEQVIGFSATRGLSAQPCPATESQGPRPLICRFPDPNA